MELSKCEILKKISEYQFICVELNLYIDTHPCDEAALRDYLVYSQELTELIAEYEQHFEPLMNFGHSPTSAGSYVCSQWPWEI